MPSSMCLSICDLYSGLQICSALFAFNLRFCVSYYSSSYVAELSTSIAPPSTSHGMPIDVSSSLVLFPLCFLLYYVYVPITIMIVMLLAMLYRYQIHAFVDDVAKQYGQMWLKDTLMIHHSSYEDLAALTIFINSRL